MAQEITTYDEVSTIDKNTKLLLTKDGGLGQKSIEEVGNVINGTGDISGIGDGTVKGAIRGLNDEMKNAIISKDVVLTAPDTFSQHKISELLEIKKCQNIVVTAQNDNTRSVSLNIRMLGTEIVEFVWSGHIKGNEYAFRITGLGCCM